MKRGFMDFVATRLIPDFPGQTAIWYAEEYLESFSDGSDAIDKAQSLASTLNKQVQTGRETRVWRKRVGGVYRYFPKSMLPASDSIEDIVIQISLSKQELEDIDNLVAVGRFNNRSDAIKWLTVEGITAKRSDLDKIADIRKQIERLKREAEGM